MYLRLSTAVYCRSDQNEFIYGYLNSQKQSTIVQKFTALFPVGARSRGHMVQRKTQKIIIYSKALTLRIKGIVL